MRITSCFNVRSRTIIPQTLLFADTHRCPWEANGFFSYCVTQKVHPLDQYLSWENIPGGLTKGSAFSQAAHHGLSASWGQDLHRPSSPQVKPHRLQPHRPQPLNLHSPTGWFCPTDVYLLVGRLVDCFITEM